MDYRVLLKRLSDLEIKKSQPMPHCTCFGFFTHLGDCAQYDSRRNRSEAKQLIDTLPGPALVRRLIHVLDAVDESDSETLPDKQDIIAAHALLGSCFAVLGVELEVEL